MAYYNRKCEKIDLTDMDFLDCGGCAKVFYDGSIIFKEYLSETILNCRLNPKMFDMLRDINNPHFVEIYDIYSDFSLIELLKYKLKMLPFIVDGYTAKYYPDNSLNVLQEHKDYILDNFRELEILFDIFTENMIVSDDVKRDNAILGKNGIIIIDPDLFYTMEASRNSISTLNKSKLLNLFRSILKSAIYDYPNYKELITFIDEELIDFEVTENTDITYEISKRLSHVRKPIELFKGIE